MFGCVWANRSSVSSPLLPDANHIWNTHTEPYIWTWILRSSVRWRNRYPLSILIVVDCLCRIFFSLYSSDIAFRLILSSESFVNIYTTSSSSSSSYNQLICVLQQTLLDWGFQIGCVYAHEHISLNTTTISNGNFWSNPRSSSIASSGACNELDNLYYSPNARKRRTSFKLDCGSTSKHKHTHTHTYAGHRRT